MVINDPNGTPQRVNNENAAKVSAISINVCHHINQIHEESYSVIISKTPTAAGDCFFYLKNLSENVLLSTSIKLYAASDEFVQVKIGDLGTPADGSANTPTNRNSGSGNTADCTCEDGVNITGLSGGSVIDDIFVDGATPQKKYSWGSKIILPKNGILTLYAVNGAILIKATLSICFHQYYK